MEDKYTLATKIRVRYSETDQMKIVYNANYLDWFEVTRTEPAAAGAAPIPSGRKTG